ncbi:MAG TPA: hypothetical protein VJ643_02965 [Nitrososphaera sp.]|nr:hypothetical protein [Nitrososphaera sp.]
MTTDTKIVQSDNRIPRWLVENDPSWEKSIDSDLGTLRWTKKGTQIQAICHPTSIFCEIVGQMDEGRNISDLLSRTRMDRHATLVSGIGDITKYLSSRYLNPSMNGRQRFDLRKTPKD